MTKYQRFMRFLCQSCGGGPGWLEVRFHEGSTRVSWFALEGSNVSCARRLKSHRSSKLRAQKIALLMGGTLSKTKIYGFQHTFAVLICSLAQTTRPEMLVGNQITLLLSITWWALGCKGSTRLRGLWGRY